MACEARWDSLKNFGETRKLSPTETQSRLPTRNSGATLYGRIAIPLVVRSFVNFQIAVTAPANVLVPFHADPKVHGGVNSRLWTNLGCNPRRNRTGSIRSQSVVRTDNPAVPAGSPPRQINLPETIFGNISPRTASPDAAGQMTKGRSRCDKTSRTGAAIIGGSIPSSGANLWA